MLNLFKVINKDIKTLYFDAAVVACLTLSAPSLKKFPIVL